VQPSAPRQGVITRHPLVFFFLLTFVFRWGWWGLWQALQLPALLIYGRTAGPTISAFVVLAITLGRAGVLRLLRSYVHWRVGVQWYLVTLIGVPVLMFLSYVVVPGALTDFVAPDWSFVPSCLGTFAFSVFLAGAPLLNNTGGSVLMAILLHAAFDAAWAFAVLFPSANTGISPISLTLGIAMVFSIAALVIIIATRGRLSYQRYQREVELPATSRTVR
jgi:hypothetical protein